jgi:hypothetical protein
VGNGGLSALITVQTTQSDFDLQHIADTLIQARERTVQKTDRSMLAVNEFILTISQKLNLLKTEFIEIDNLFTQMELEEQHATNNVTDLQSLIQILDRQIGVRERLYEANMPVLEAMIDDLVATTFNTHKQCLGSA